MNQQFLFEEFYDLKSVSQGVFSSIQSAKSLKQSSDKQITMKTFDATSSKLDNLIKNEINLWERISNLDLKPKAIPNYSGFVKSKPNQYHLVFDIPPHTLKEIIDDSKSNQNSDPFPFDQLKASFESLIKTFAFLQTMNICHIDLKPANLFYDKNINQIYVIDLGVSKEMIIKASTEMKKEFSLTGSSLYFPPEVDNALNSSSSHINAFKADVFSLALSFLEVGTLQLPSKIYGVPQWKEGIESLLKRFKEIYRETMQSTEDKKNLEEFVRVLKTCLSFSPEDRPDFIELFLESMRKINDDKLRLHILLEEQILQLENLKNLEKIGGKGFSFFGKSPDENVDVRIWGRALNSIDKDSFLDEE